MLSRLVSRVSPPTALRLIKGLPANECWFMPFSSLAVCAGAFGHAVTEIHEILGWLLNEIPRRKGDPMFSTGNVRAAPSRRSSSIVAINLAEDHEMTNR
jgi:hypothetical protein